MAISTPMLVTFIVYIFGMVLIGFIAWRSTRTLMIIFSAAAALAHSSPRSPPEYSDMSGWLLMGLPGRYLFPVFPKAGLPLA